mmetsp:Transcript_9548/g.29081  ORF Transcript_9548/g.29081 Transcript_9548/m.29081 type:complete len:529 (-) Transcript_9548:151-1737(-)
MSREVAHRQPPPSAPVAEGEGKVLTTTASQGGASGFASSGGSSLTGAGVLFSCDWLGNRNDVAEHLGDRPSEGDVAAAVSLLSACAMDSMMLEGVGETVTLSAKPSWCHPSTYRVQPSHMDKIQRRYSKVFTTTTSSRTTLGSLGCHSGIANESSEPDGCFWKTLTLESKEQIVIAGGIVEAKSLTATPGEALGQVFAESTGVAMQFLAKGMAAEDVVVPIMTTNGQLVKFGITRLLKPSFPYLAAISKTLDLSDKGDLQKAAELLAHVMAWCQRAEEVSGPKCTSPAMELSEKYWYHLKPLTSVFHVFEDDPSESVRHMLRVLAKALSSDDARKFVVPPITLRTHDDTRAGNQGQGDSLVFENLDRDGFELGVPTNENQRILYFAALRVAMKAIHDAGVVHLDLYPSNIMWREHEGNIIIKIIDWDTAHFLNEALTPSTQDRMNDPRNHYRRVLAGFPQGHQPATALAIFDSSLVDLLESIDHHEKRDYWSDATVTKEVMKKRLDGAFNCDGLAEAANRERRSVSSP